MIGISEIENLGDVATRDWEPPEVRGLRSAAAREAELLELPTEDEEDWRYTDTSGINLDALVVPPPVRSPEPADIESLTAKIPAGLHDALGNPAGVIVVADGSVVGQALYGGLPNVEFGAANAIDDIESAWTWSESQLPSDKFEALAAAIGAEAFLHLHGGATVERPFVICQEVNSSGQLSAAHSMIRLEPASAARIVILQTGSPDDKSLHLPVTEVLVEDDASLELLVIQDFASKVDQIGSISINLRRDARVKVMSATLGGGLSRLRTTCRLAGEGSESELLGLSLGKGSSHIDHRTLQDHVASHTSSNLLFKAVVDESASSVFSGLIRVEKGVQKVAGYQTNRNLILSETASAESVPNLEILANDVKCSHASATGPIDDDQLYYLQSRGIASEVAERLLVLGFLGEVAARSPIPKVHLRELVAARISSRDGGTDGGV